MAIATITLTDDPAGPDNVGVSVDFGPDGADNDSPAHHLALAMVRSQLGGPSDKEDD